jgi:signal transduction histidine kinase
MRSRAAYRTWAVFSIALFSLLALMLVPTYTALQRSQAIYHEIRAMQENYERSQRILEAITRDVFVTSIVVREFLLDSSETAGVLYGRRLTESRNELRAQIADLRRFMQPGELAQMDQLDREVNGYLASIAPILRWTPRQRDLRGTFFLREEQRPTRQSVLAIAAEIERINTSLYRQQSERVNQSERQFRHDLQRTMWLVILAGALIAGASISRIALLEGRARRQHERDERLGQELRHLSTRLRQAQEEERKTISRELHDEVGQKLTALRIGLGGVERMRAAGEEPYRLHLDEMKGLAEQSLKIIRDIAGGLRPSILDDLGLGPALQRQTREFARHTGIPVEVKLTGDLEGLNDRSRTSIYRIVQESLTNCARHARASHIELAVDGAPDRVELTVSDDGAGFDPGAVASGMGLIGIEERVRELEGDLLIDSAPGKGTRLRVRLARNGSHA